MWYLYGIKDGKSEEFGPIFQAKRDEVAIRMFSESMRDQSSMIARYPADFCLYCLGSYNEENGIVFGEDIGPRSVVEGSTVASLMSTRENLEVAANGDR